MSQGGGVSFAVTLLLLATALLPDLGGAGPLAHQEASVDGAVQEKGADGGVTPGRGARHRRNAQPDFWSWYKYNLDIGNREGVADLDRVYVGYLQNRHRIDGDHTFGHYLQHLNAIYKSCANSDDPDCIAEYTSKPQAQLLVPKAAAHAEAPALAPLSAPLFYPYQPAPLLMPFLSPQQQEELLRICQPSDTECLQYHLRASYGYRPYYAPPGQLCNPLFDPQCNPLSAARPAAALSAYTAKSQPAPLTRCNPPNPYCH